MTYDPDERAILLGRHIAQTGATVRQTAEVFKISKSTVHKDVNGRLKKLAPTLYLEVKIILAHHLAVRHLRGGAATAARYKKIRSGKQDLK